jgi:VanZ family protein
MVISRWASLGLFVGGCLGLAVLSLLPGEHLPPATWQVWDKAQHALAYAVLGGVGFVAFAHARGRVVVGLLLYGACIELAQAATGWRQGDVWDVLANAVGLGVVYVLWRQ